LKREIEKLLIEVSEFEKRIGKGEFNSLNTKVLHFKMNPQTIAESKKELEDLKKLKSENQLLIEELEKYRNETRSGSKSSEELKRKIYDLELTTQRLKQVFKKKSDDFRKVVYLLFGFRVDAIQNDMYKLSSIYAEYEEDHLMFQLDGKELKILETDFTVTLEKSITDYLSKFHSYPAFLSSVTHHLFKKQTTF
jgi:mitotic spindle assembly checkpoint protein MAD1